MGYSPEERCADDLPLVKVLTPASSGVVHPNSQEVKQR